MKKKNVLIFSKINYKLDKNLNLILISKNILDFSVYKLNNFKIISDSSFSYNNYNYKNFNKINAKTNIYLKQFSKILNKVHKKNYDDLYWGKLLYVFFYDVISLIILRTDIIVATKKKVKNLCYFDNIKKIFIFYNSHQLSDNIISDDFNLFLFERISEILDLEKINGKNLVRISLENSNKINLLDYIKKKIIFILVILFKPVLITDSYLSTSDILKIFFKSKFKILAVDSNLVFPLKSHKQNDDISHKLRKILKVKEKDLYDKVFNSIIENLFPKSFLEDYQFLLSKTEFISSNINGLGSAINHISSDFYKILFSESQIKNKKIFSLQHGSHYGNYDVKFNPLYYFEKKYLNKNYLYNNNKGIGIGHLRRIKKIDPLKLRDKRQITIIGTKRFFYPTRVESNNFFFNEKLYDKYKVFYNFVNNFKDELKPLFYAKPSPGDDMHLFNKDLYILYKKNKLTEDSVNKIIQNSSIVLLDHFSTTFYEILYSEVPFLIFFNSKDYNFNYKFMKILNDLRKVGVFFENSTSIPYFINNNHFRISDWWYENKRQKVINNVRHELINENKDFINNFISDIITIK
jgi:putative transferase (TIGR04331 family)